MNRGKKHTVVTRHTRRSRSVSDGCAPRRGDDLWGTPCGKGAWKAPDEQWGVSGVSPVIRYFLFSLSVSLRSLQTPFNLTFHTSILWGGAIISVSTFFNAW